MSNETMSAQGPVDVTVGHRYAGTPGNGPAGTTCKRCLHLVLGTLGRSEKSHPFCRLVADAQGPMATAYRPRVWTGTKSCERYKPIHARPTHNEGD